MPDTSIAQDLGIASTSSNWGSRLAAHLKLEAERSRSLDGGNPRTRGHAAALGQIADYAIRVGVDDPVHVLALEIFISSGRGRGDATPYVPSPTALRVIATVGYGPSGVVNPRDVLLAIFAGELRDLARQFREVESQSTVVGRAAERDRDAAAESSAEARRLSDLLIRTQADLTKARIDHDVVAERVSFWKEKAEALEALSLEPVGPATPETDDGPTDAELAEIERSIAAMEARIDADLDAEQAPPPAVVEPPVASDLSLEDRNAEIARLYATGDYQLKDLAARFGVSVPTASRAASGKSSREVTQ